MVNSMIKYRPTKTHLAIGGGVFALLVALIYFLGKSQGRTENTSETIDVKVRINDQNGGTILYDPIHLVRALNKGLTTTYFWDFSERCEPIKELYELEAVQFMATVAAYKKTYGEDIQTHMRACHRTCSMPYTDKAEIPADYFTLIYNKINNLNQIIN